VDLHHAPGHHRRLLLDLHESEWRVNVGCGRMGLAADLTRKQISTQTQLSPEIPGELRFQHGDSEVQFRAATDRGFDPCREFEAHQLARLKPPESVRDRIAAAELHGSGSSGAGDPGVSEEVAGIHTSPIMRLGTQAAGFNPRPVGAERATSRRMVR